MAGDGGTAIAIDAKGNAYVTGDTTSRDFPTKNAFQSEYKDKYGSSNALVTKFDQDGDSLLYSTYLGGSGIGNNIYQYGDIAFGIAVDEHGNAYIAGWTASSDFPIKDAFQPKLKSLAGADAFITKIDAAGSALIYSSYLGGSSGDSSSIGNAAFGIGIDPHGNAYVKGFTSSTDFPIKDAFQPFLKGFGNAFVAKISAH